MAVTPFEVVLDKHQSPGSIILTNNRQLIYVENGKTLVLSHEEVGRMIGAAYQEVVKKKTQSTCIVLNATPHLCDLCPLKTSCTIRGAIE